MTPATRQPLSSQRHVQAKQDYHASPEEIQSFLEDAAMHSTNNTKSEHMSPQVAQREKATSSSVPKPYSQEQHEKEFKVEHFIKCLA